MSDFIESQQCIGLFLFSFDTLEADMKEDAQRVSNAQADITHLAAEIID